MKLILLPGMDGTGELFAPLIAALDADIDVVQLSYPVDKAMDYQALEGLVRALLPIDEPYVLLGESFSGPIAVSIAAAAPDQLKGVILCCSFIRNPRPMLSGLGFLIGLLPPPALVPARLISWLLMGGFASSPVQRSLKLALAKVGADVFRARLRAILLVDVAEELARVLVPVLYMRAMHDRTVPRAASALIGRVAPDMQFADVDAPHFLLQLAPSEAAGLIHKFVGEISDR